MRQKCVLEINFQNKKNNYLKNTSLSQFSRKIFHMKLKFINIFVNKLKQKNRMTAKIRLLSFMDQTIWPRRIPLSYRALLTSVFTGFYLFLINPADDVYENHGLVQKINFFQPKLEI